MNYIGALTAIWTANYYNFFLKKKPIKSNKPTKLPLLFIYWLCFLLGVNIGMLIILILK